MCYTRRKIEGGVFTLRECDDTNFLKPNGQSRNLNIYGLGHKVTKACSSIKASQVELFMAFYDYGVEIILRLKTRQEYLWIFWFLGYSSSLSVLRIRRWLLVNHVSPLASVSAEGLPATNRNLFIFQVSLHRVLELYIIWATALIWCMIYALFLAWPPCCLVE